VPEKQENKLNNMLSQIIPTEDTAVSVSTIHHHEDHHHESTKDERDKWTLRRDNIYYKGWRFTVVIVGAYSTFLYPYYTANQFPERWSI
jgi:hypothetical protein